MLELTRLAAQLIRLTMMEITLLGSPAYELLPVMEIRLVRREDIEGYNCLGTTRLGSVARDGYQCWDHASWERSL